MDFFTAQDRARRKTGRLVVLMVLAVIALITVTTLAIAIALHLMGGAIRDANQPFYSRGVVGALD